MTVAASVSAIKPFTTALAALTHQGGLAISSNQAWCASSSSPGSSDSISASASETSVASAGPHPPPWTELAAVTIKSKLVVGASHRSIQRAPKAFDMAMGAINQATAAINPTKDIKRVRSK